MPTIEISKRDLEKLVGKKISLKELENLLLVVKGELESTEGDAVSVDIKDINRPDLWSTTGIARELRGELGKEKGLVKFNVKPNAKNKVIVSRELEKIRPLTVCAVLRNLKLNEEAISQIVMLQEKLSENFGRERKEAALGIYDADKITFPIHFKAADPDKTKFQPLDFPRKLTLRKILSRHEKGRIYGKLLKRAKKYPIFIDSAGEILSMPPIINSNYSGKITSQTKNAFVEVSGFSFRFIVPCLLVFVAELAERGASIEAVNICYGRKKVIMPDFKPKKAILGIDYCNKTLGLDLKATEIKSLLEKRRHNVKVKGEKIEVEYAAYRQDIIHERDIVEEIAIAYGYNKIEPRAARLAVTGGTSKPMKMEEKIAGLLAGLGLQEVATFNLTAKKELFKKMNLDEQSIVEIENPVSSAYACLRNWLTPSLLAFLAKNKKAKYPQKVFEIGDCVLLHGKNVKDIRRLCVMLTHAKADYTEIRQILDYLLRNLNYGYRVKEVEHASFIQGRVGRVVVNGKKVAYIGEISPKVLQNFNLGMPAACFELNLSELLG